MSTEARISANCRNAESSTGPRTEGGKSRSSRNAVSFGIYSAGDFVRPDEAHTYQIFCQGFRKDLRPEGPLEQTLAAEIIHAAWRLRRCSVAESEMQLPAENEPDPLFSRAQASIDRARGEAQRQLLRSMNELRRLRKERQVRLEYLRQSSDINAIGGLAGIETVPAATPAAGVSPSELPTTKRTQSGPPSGQPIARSAPCPCGSGVKYKRCCGRNAPAILRQAA